MLLDWNGYTNIDIVNVWEREAVWEDNDGIGGQNDLYQGPKGIAPHRDAIWELVSRDVNGATFGDLQSDNEVNDFHSILFELATDTDSNSDSNQRYIIFRA